MKKILLSILIYSFITTAPAFAGRDFFGQNHRGWFNFEEKLKEEVEMQSQSNGSFATATEELQSFQKEFDERKARMVLHPNAPNVRSYLIYQNKMFKLADKLNIAWKAALLADPELNIVKGISVADSAVKIRDLEEKKASESTILALGQKFKLLFFYKKSCPYCHNFSQVLAAFAAKYKFKVASVSLDGGQLERFPAVQNPKLVANLKIKVAPTLMIFSEESGIIAPLAHGFVPLEDLEKNMIFVAMQLKGKL